PGYTIPDENLTALGKAGKDGTVTYPAGTVAMLTGPVAPRPVPESESRGAQRGRASGPAMRPPFRSRSPAVWVPSSLS
ncbi:hypothetical protein ACWD8C_43535, partial [Streptomyces sp. NPDC005166]